MDSSNSSSSNFTWDSKDSNECELLHALQLNSHSFRERVSQDGTPTYQNLIIIGGGVHAAFLVSSLPINALIIEEEACLGGVFSRYVPRTRRSPW